MHGDEYRNELKLEKTDDSDGEINQNQGERVKEHQDKRLFQEMNFSPITSRLVQKERKSRNDARDDGNKCKSKGISGEHHRGDKNANGIEQNVEETSENER